jgi:hypothetical protein
MKHYIIKIDTGNGWKYINTRQNDVIKIVDERRNATEYTSWTKVARAMARALRSFQGCEVSVHEIE